MLHDHPALGALGWGDDRSIDEAEFDRACAFLQACAAPSTARCRSSYGTKREAERWFGFSYISSGAMIAAAIACGFTHRRTGLNSTFDLELLATERPIGTETTMSALVTIAHKLARGLKVDFFHLWHSIPDSVPPGTDALALVDLIGDELARRLSLTRGTGPRLSPQAATE